MEEEEEAVVVEVLAVFKLRLLIAECKDETEATTEVKVEVEVEVEVEAETDSEADSEVKDVDG